MSEVSADMNRNLAPGGTEPFHHYVGISNLDQIATPADRVCVLNILGQESRLVTPISHVFSGGNVVFGTSPGRSGQVLPTDLGDIPVYNDVREGLAAGHAFDTGVVYLPPSAVRDGVAELTRVNPGLRKIIIVTEKVAVNDAREIRAIAQARRVDIFGANGLGVADSWNRIRIGGALGGDDPDGALVKGSIAIFSNSGNFTSTIAAYLASAGWGTTTLVSSGKDVYIHFAAPEFLHAFENDRRSKAAVLYVEPGGYYEQALRSDKPIVACVVGRWKARLTRAVGHAGAMAGSGDDAFAKEKWFLEQFGCDAPFTPDNPVCSARGALVLNIAHIPAALDAVMKLRGEQPDFAARGDLSLKAWFGNNQGLPLPDFLDQPVIAAPDPYAQQIRRLGEEIGARFIRQSMRETSGATQLDARTQSARLHGVSVLEAASSGFSANLALALLRERPDEDVVGAIDAALCAFASLPADARDAVETVRRSGNAPNLLMAVAASCLGPLQIQSARQATDLLVDHLFGIRDRQQVIDSLSGDETLLQAEAEAGAAAMMAALRQCPGAQDLVKFLDELPGLPSPRLALAAVCAHAAEGALRRRRISRQTANALPWHIALAARMIASLGPETATANVGSGGFASVIGARLAGMPTSRDFDRRLAVLVGLLVTNGPGTISALGAKGAVSADGPETPARIQLNKAYVGFLSHAGFAHGGNGFEGVRFLLDCFEGVAIGDPSRPDPDIDLQQVAARFVAGYRADKAARSGSGTRSIIPGVNHPVFRGKAVNSDPREAHVWDFGVTEGRYNLFHAFYRQLVEELFQQGATPNVFCVNVDGVIAAELLAIFWPMLRDGGMTNADLETAAFAVFLVARIIGSAAEIEDHANRGRDMDMRTPNENCRFVA